MLDAQEESNSVYDLVGGPFAVIESDPDVFTNLLRKLGVRGLEVTEVFDITDPFIDEEETQFIAGDDEDLEDTPDSDAEDIWFAHQLCNDACASQAIINIVLNLENVSLQAPLEEFKRDTDKMSPLMKGLAFTNCAFIREAHNSFACPADNRAALHSAAHSALEYSKKGAKKRKSKSKQDNTAAVEDTYHFIGYVPAHGRVWELNGLRSSGPLEVGEIPEGPDHRMWMDIVRPAVRKRMRRLETDHIRFNLLAIVEGKYEKVSDELEMLKRQRKQLERRLDEAYPDGWTDKVDKDLLAESEMVFNTTAIPDGTPGHVFGSDFASRKMEIEMSILDAPVRKLVDMWQACVRQARSARLAVEDEIRAAERAQVDHVSRTFDYQPFLERYITMMYNEGLLQSALSSTTAVESDGVDDPVGEASNRKRRKSKP